MKFIPLDVAVRKAKIKEFWSRREAVALNRGPAVRAAPISVIKIDRE